VLIRLDDMVISAVQCGDHRCLTRPKPARPRTCASLHSAGCVLNGTPAGALSTPMYQGMSATGTDDNSAEPLRLDVGFNARWAVWQMRGRIHERAVRPRLVTKLRLKLPSNGQTGEDGESSLLGGRFAAAAKTASKAEPTKTCFLCTGTGFRRCLGPAPTVASTAANLSILLIR
jgi:hypothetical protein